MPCFSFERLAWCFLQGSLGTEFLKSDQVYFEAYSIKEVGRRQFILFVVRHVLHEEFVMSHLKIRDLSSYLLPKWRNRKLPEMSENREFAILTSQNFGTVNVQADLRSTNSFCWDRTSQMNPKQSSERTKTVSTYWWESTCKEEAQPVWPKSKTHKDPPSIKGSS